MASASTELQTAIYNALISAPAVSAIVGTNVVDGKPASYPAISFGPSDFVPEDMDCIDGREETIQIDCWVRDGSKRLRPAKDLADAVYNALHNQPLQMNVHALTRIYVESVRAMMDPDGLTSHSWLSVTAEIEQR